MHRPSPLFSLAALAVLLLLPARLAADLVWTPDGGWKVEGGALSSLMGEDGRNALDLMNKARLAEEAGKDGTALRHYNSVTKRYRNSVYAAEALYRTGLIQQKQRKYHKAFQSYQALVSGYPNSEKFNQVIGEQYRIASDLTDGKRAKTWSWFPGFRSRERGVAYFETIVFTAPYSDYAPLALMNAAKGYKKMNETPAAIDALDRMINTYPRNVLTPDAYLRIAETHTSLVDGPAYDQASTTDAITYYEDYMILFPGHSGMAAAEKGLDEMKTVLAQSKLVIADYYFKHRKNYKAAKVFYNEAITVYPDSAVATQAREKLTVVDAKLEEMAAAAPAPSDTPKPATPKKPKRFWIF
ncbi:tol-pal system protein YbgF [Lacunisphaera limnophila]|uniref:Tol-pal system protein YbgF n=1 Tax=Lacunisphaera limnophila TaxID=1838286 RepID=A0A1D8AWY9_9BACT|nr:tetratricopeptide repeat protein [Lacunisphaera limnophila]AOS45408.1 tol-pal system protein YbgF [Lacunisphaera limnophila]